MKIICSLLIIPFLAGCKITRSPSPGNYESLQSCIAECIDAALPEEFLDQHYAGYGTTGSGGGNKSRQLEWHHRLGASDEEIANRLSELRQLLITRLTEEGANIHGSSPPSTSLNHSLFSIEHTSAGEGGIVWATRTSEGDKKHIFIFWHGVNIN